MTYINIIEVEGLFCGLLLKISLWIKKDVNIISRGYLWNNNKKLVFRREDKQKFLKEKIERNGKRKEEIGSDFSLVC